VESEEGVGSTFYFSISAQVAKPSTPTLPFPSCCSSPSVAQFNFLVVDESSSGAEALVLILQEVGCMAHHAQNMTSTLVLVRTENFDVVFLTRALVLWQTSEAETLTEEYPALFLTDTPNTADYHNTALPQGVVGRSIFRAFLPKPYRTDIVRSIIQTSRKNALSDYSKVSFL
jgi:CheY-like chemotaxis protein